jgi:hypothetical protein
MRSRLSSAGAATRLADRRTTHAPRQKNAPRQVTGAPLNGASETREIAFRSRRGATSGCAQWADQCRARADEGSISGRERRPSQLLNPMRPARGRPLGSRQRPGNVNGRAALAGRDPMGSACGRNSHREPKIHARSVPRNREASVRPARRHIATRAERAYLIATFRGMSA